MRVVAFDLEDAPDLAALVEFELRLHRLEVDRSAALARLRESAEHTRETIEIVCDLRRQRRAVTA